MKIPKLKKIESIKKHHGISLEDDYAWVDQPNILEVLKDPNKLLPEVRNYIEENNSITIKVHINPLVGWAWAALPIFTIGIGICLTYRPKSLIAQEIVNRERYLATLES